MNNRLIQNTVRFIGLIILQAILFNKIILFGFIVPYPYLIFIILFPITKNHWLFILISFLYGLSLDMFCNSGGAHAAACLIVAYIRPLILQSTFGINYKYQSIKLNKVGFKELSLYIALICIIHHAILFSLEVFEIKQLYFIALQTLFSSIFSIITILLGLSLFKKN